MDAGSQSFGGGLIAFWLGGLLGWFIGGIYAALWTGFLNVVYPST